MRDFYEEVSFKHSLQQSYVKKSIHEISINEYSTMTQALLAAIRC